MGDRPPDDTDQPAAPRRERKPGAYYYDDQTGYEPYDPADDEDDDHEGDDRSDTATGA